MQFNYRFSLLVLRGLREDSWTDSQIDRQRQTDNEGVKGIWWREPQKAGQRETERERHVYKEDRARTKESERIQAKIAIERLGLLKARS